MVRTIHKNKGMTLIELMVVIGIVAILAAIAAPSFAQLLASNRVQAATSEFQAALALARGEAIKRGGDAHVTVVANGLTGTPPTAAWQQGVTVFYDMTSNANADVAPSDTTLFQLKTAALTSSVVVMSSFTNSIVYNGMGRPLPATGAQGNGTIAFGDKNGNTDWRCTIVSATGRVRSTTVSASTASSSVLTQCTA